MENVACLLGKSNINGPFSIAMLVYQRVIIRHRLSRFGPVSSTTSGQPETTPSSDATWQSGFVTVGFRNQQSITRVLFDEHVLTGAKRREWMGCWGLLG